MQSMTLRLDAIPKIESSVVSLRQSIDLLEKSRVVFEGETRAALSSAMNAASSNWTSQVVCSIADRVAKLESENIGTLSPSKERESLLLNEEGNAVFESVQTRETVLLNTISNDSTFEMESSFENSIEELHSESVNASYFKENSHMSHTEEELVLDPSNYNVEDLSIEKLTPMKYDHSAIIELSGSDIVESSFQVEQEDHISAAISSNDSPVAINSPSSDQKRLVFKLNTQSVNTSSPDIVDDFDDYIPDDLANDEPPSSSIGTTDINSKYSNFQKVLESSEFKQRTSELQKSEIHVDEGVTAVLAFDDSESFDDSSVQSPVNKDSAAIHMSPLSVLDSSSTADQDVAVDTSTLSVKERLKLRLKKTTSQQSSL